MTMYFKLLSSIIGLIISSSLFAQTSIKVIETSSSKKSLIIDRGLFEGIEVGQTGVLYKNEGEEDSPKLTKVAEVRVVKVVKKQSFWFVTKMDKQSFLYPDSIL